MCVCVCVSALVAFVCFVFVDKEGEGEAGGCGLITFRALPCLAASSRVTPVSKVNATGTIRLIKRASP